MKKIIFTFAIVVAIVHGTTAITNATATRFYVKISISDNCSPQPYNGYYCVQWQLTYQGNVLCTTTNCTLRKGDNGCVEFSCDIPEQTLLPYYGIAFVSAARYPSGNCYPGTDSGSSDFYWDDMTNSNCVATLSVTL